MASAHASYYSVTPNSLLLPMPFTSLFASSISSEGTTLCDAQSGFGRDDLASWELCAHVKVPYQVI